MLSQNSPRAGLPSRGGDVKVYVSDRNQLSLPTPFHSVLVSFSVFMALSTVFHCINSPDNSPFSFCSSDLISALLALSTIYLFMKVSFSPDITPQWGAADAEIKVPSGENTELKLSPFQAWSRSVYSHTCYAYCQGFLSFLLISTLPVHSPAFFPKPLPIFPVLAVANTWFL